MPKIRICPTISGSCGFLCGIDMPHFPLLCTASRVQDVLYCIRAHLVVDFDLGQSPLEQLRLLLADPDFSFTVDTTSPLLLEIVRFVRFISAGPLRSVVHIAGVAAPLFVQVVRDFFAGSLSASVHKLVVSEVGWGALLEELSVSGRLRCLTLRLLARALSQPVQFRICARTLEFDGLYHCSPTVSDNVVALVATAEICELEVVTGLFSRALKNPFIRYLTASLDAVHEFPSLRVWNVPFAFIEPRSIDFTGCPLLSIIDVYAFGDVYDCYAKMAPSSLLEPPRQFGVSVLGGRGLGWKPCTHVAFPTFCTSLFGAFLAGLERLQQDLTVAEPVSYFDPAVAEEILRSTHWRDFN